MLKHGFWKKLYRQVYEKSGKAVSISSEQVNRETVKNKLYALKFPKKESYPHEKRIEKGKGYLLNNWTASRLRLLQRNGVKGSCTEGHVSHILSNRMNSRSMEWSKEGMSKIAELRAYYYNKGDMLELVRYQKKELPMVAGSEKIIDSSSRMWREERKRKRELLGQLADILVYSILYNQIKKITNFKTQIFGL